MGRLKIFKKQTKHIIQATLAILFLIIVYSLALGPSVEKSELQGYLKNNNLIVGSQQVDGYGQIYYEYKDKRTYITNDKKNHIAPKSSGRYIAWLDESGGRYQVILYDLVENTQLKLSVISSNSNVSLDGNKVAWEGMKDGKTIIYYFNGQSVKQISGKYTSIRPFVKADKVLYAQQLESKSWQTIEYDDSTSDSRTIVEGSSDKAAWPRYEGDEIKTSNKGSAQYY